LNWPAAAPEQVAEAVRRTGARAILEASGGISLDSIGAYAATGVQRISLGFITHSAPAADLGLELEVGRHADAT
jgi:nicotinate-nucleotide pyrophosphorylase (carboxylating)